MPCHPRFPRRADWQWIAPQPPARPRATPFRRSRYWPARRRRAARAALRRGHSSRSRPPLGYRGRRITPARPRAQREQRRSEDSWHTPSNKRGSGRVVSNLFWCRRNAVDAALARFLAPLRHADARSECLLIGVDRKWSAHGQNDEFDPNRSIHATETRARENAQPGFSSAVRHLGRSDFRSRALVGAELARDAPAPARWSFRSMAAVKLSL